MIESCQCSVTLRTYLLWVELKKGKCFMAIHLQWNRPSIWHLFWQHFIHSSRIGELFQQIYSANIWSRRAALWNYNPKK